MFKILITGGHLTPALAFIDYCQAERTGVKLVFAGRKWAQAETGQSSWEESEVKRRSVPFVDFDAPKTGSFSLVAFYQSYQKARQILLERQISHVLSFGGYLALPITLAATKLGLPVITHEQTRVLGRANRLISLVAQKIAVSFPETKTLFPKKTVVTGNPLRPGIFCPPAKVPAWYKSTEEKKPLLGIAGGSQGARIINQTLLPVLKQLASDYIIIHQVGKDSEKYQPRSEVLAYLKQQQLHLPHYYPREFLTEQEQAYFFPLFELMISRAGANSVAEFTAFKLPVLYIPLPQANYQEQFLNAQALAAQGAALILEQKGLTPIVLLENLDRLWRERETLKANLAKITLPKNPSANLFKLLGGSRLC